MNRETRGARGGAMNGDLLRKIQALAFAKTETELYLDGHPDCTAALEYYREVVRELDGLMNEYEGSTQTIRQENESGERWTWVEKPWPWQLGEEG